MFRALSLFLLPLLVGAAIKPFGSGDPPQQSQDKQPQGPPPLPPLWSFRVLPRPVTPNPQIPPPGALRPPGEKEDHPDYYDELASQDEATASTTKKAQRVSVDDAVHLMTALRANVDPVPMETKEEKGTDPKKSNQKDPKLTLDGDTYDDERAAAGRADEADTGDSDSSEEGAGPVPSIVELNTPRPATPKRMTVVVLDGPEAGVHDASSSASDEAEEAAEGQTGPEKVVDGETKKTPDQQQEGMAAKPPKAKIARMAN